MGAKQLAAIEHVIVLMLENRSFDHMLGFLCEDPGEGYSATNLQLFSADPASAPPVATNSGFVRSRGSSCPSSPRPFNSAPRLPLLPTWKPPPTTTVTSELGWRDGRRAGHELAQSGICGEPMSRLVRMPAVRRKHAQ